MNILTALLDLLFPPKCPFCGKIQDASGICPACWEDLPWTGEAHSLRELEPGLRCAAPLWYEGIVRDGIRRFKFHNAVGTAVPLGSRLAQCAAECFSGGFDAVTWVPVSSKRLRRRGYDQSRLLAENACKLWGVRPERLVRKIRDNPAQSSLDGAAARRKNTEGVYKATGSVLGKRILLIDDVCTTGATLSSCAAALRAAGAEEVVCAAAAFPRPGNSRENRGEKGKE